MGLEDRKETCQRRGHGKGGQHKPGQRDGPEGIGYARAELAGHMLARNEDEGDQDGNSNDCLYAVAEIEAVQIETRFFNSPKSFSSSAMSSAVRPRVSAR